MGVNRLRAFGGRRWGGTSGGGSGGGATALLTYPDLTWEGQAGAPDMFLYGNPVLAIRYVGGERRYLLYEFNDSLPEAVGDLVEYRFASTLKNGAADWNADNIPTLTEVRRWSNWHTLGRISAVQYPPIVRSRGGAGVYPSSFFWDEARGVLWYTWQPIYAAAVWPAYSAVKLTNAEAGGSVSAGNIYGPFYFRDSSQVADYKWGGCGIIPIPANRQAGMGGKYLAVGHHCAVIGSNGPRSISIAVINDLPDPATKAQNDVLWPGAVHLYDTSTDSGVVPPNMKRPNNCYQATTHGSQGTQFWFGTTPTDVAVGVPIGYGHTTGNTAGECLYQHDYGRSDTLVVRMVAGCVGGSWVPEIWTGAAWVQPAGWAMANGAADLSGTENVFYWPQVVTPVKNIGATDAGGTPLGAVDWVRLRRVTAGSAAGTIDTVLINNTLVDANPYTDRPEGQGGYSATADGQYDATHYAHCYEELFWGGAWVQTPNVEGLAYFGPLKTAGIFYGATPTWVQPKNGGVPTRITCSQDKVANFPPYTSYDNGGKYSGPQLPFFFPFDHGKLLTMAADPSKRNATFLNPESYTELTSRIPGLIIGTVPNVENPHAGEKSCNLYGWGHSVVFDPVTSDLIVLITNGGSWSPRNVLAFWRVR